jgi:hypothetical protein
MDTKKLRKLAEQCRSRAQVDKTIKTAQLLEALTGLETLKRKVNR